ncbi:hypothetical protein [Helicobacter turcicus]|uniref:Uncharacterized protein n=1 Tax=Helicobacter turcicus TaxID=2867412 RepID=A0ABS7JKG8_9HELI|nr:hypothetical protein [Helicobacter turcicus]MBX7489893.1 hypothetical protein [Helicobacter turcicus]MBX7544753.1 hypothetical protein [Helicobacter turcicus]
MTADELHELYKRLGVYGVFIYGTIMKLQNEGEKLTMETIHARSIEYILKNKMKLEEGSDITKMLPKLATFDKATQEWKLKSNMEILQCLRETQKSGKN